MEMKLHIRSIMSIIILCNAGCTKTDPTSTNYASLFANAGTAKYINLPETTVMLDGSASSDHQNSIVSFRWKKVSGPTSFNIQDSTAARTLVTNLSSGDYLFELTVTNNKGASAKDTTLVSVGGTSAFMFWVSMSPNYSLLTVTNNSTVLKASIHTVNGSANNIITKEWRKISGPAAGIIISPASEETLVSGLTTGVYQFQFKVTGTNGLSNALITTVAVIDPSSPDQELIISNLLWGLGPIGPGAGCNYINIDLDQYIPAGSPVKKVFIKPQCNPSWIEAPIEPISNVYTYSIYDGHYLTINWCYGGCSSIDMPDIRILY
jgi:hypothetical protein